MNIYKFNSLDEVKQAYRNEIDRLDKHIKRLSSFIGDNDTPQRQRANLRKQVELKTVEMETFMRCLAMLEGYELPTIETSNLEFHFIDICYPDYLQDHHNRDNEYLVSVPFVNGMSNEQLAEEIRSEIQAYGVDVPLPDYKTLYNLIWEEIKLIDLWIDDLEPDHEMLVYGYFSW